MNLQESTFGQDSTLQGFADGKGIDKCKLGLEAMQVSTSLMILTHQYYALSELSFRRFRFLRQLRFIWRAHRTHKLYLVLGREAKRLLEEGEKDLFAELQQAASGGREK